MNWEGWIVLRDHAGKVIGKFGGVPSRVDMLWLARLIRGRFALGDRARTGALRPRVQS